ncbi:hypothetical protein J2X72_004422 [Phyllobacterium sp. 1468]|nr:hypothetical protein [Phyllobacterium sp. 1468]
MAVQVNYYGDKHSFESSILFTSKAIPGREDHVSDILVTAETWAHSFWRLYRNTARNNQLD